MDKRKLKRIKRIAASARAEIKKMGYRNGWWSFDVYDLGGACGIASYLLHEVLIARGFKSQLMFGEFEGGTHFWVQVGSTIVDITHTQFTVEAEKVALFPSNHKGFKPETWYTKDAKRELFTWETYKDFEKRLDNAKRRLLKRFRHV